MLKIFGRIKKPSLRWGLFLGIILGIVEIVYNFGSSYITDASIQPILGYILAFLFIIAGFYAGFRASRETGKWTSGLAAGLWVAVFGTIVFYIIPLVNTLLHLQSIVASQQLELTNHPIKGIKPSDYTASDVIITQLVGMCLDMGFCALFTTVSGGYGGFIGRRRALAAQVSQSDESSRVETSTPESANTVQVSQENEPTRGEVSAPKSADLPQEMNAEKTQDTATK